MEQLGRQVQPVRPPEAGLLWILENPRLVKAPGEKVTIPAFSSAQDLLTAMGGRDLALGNHENAGLALATFFGILVLQHPLAQYDPTAWATHLAWLQILKSLKGLSLKAALESVKEKTVIVPQPAVQAAPSSGITEKVKGALGR